jgi:(1->4)-alpha-D-glucan 1-alpha-D-glucosylmutase
VDPDNRRRVDFAQRAALLESVDDGLAGDRARVLAAWLTHWHDGRIKLATTRILLALRARLPQVFDSGAYEPCAVTGPRATELVAFVRREGESIVLTAVQRFPVRAERSRDWRGTRIVLPEDAGRMTDVLTGRGFRGDLDPAELLATLPVAVLEQGASREQASR